MIFIIVIVKYPSMIFKIVKYPSNDFHYRQSNKMDLGVH
jgi:hypothetical protein